MSSRTRYQKFKARSLGKPTVRKAYEQGLDDLRLAVRLAELREKRGLTQTELAARIRTSPSVISRLERGENVEFKTLKKVAQALHARFIVEPVSP